MNKPVVTDEQLLNAAYTIMAMGMIPRSYAISRLLETKGIKVDQSTIRTRFIEMGKPLSTMPLEVPANFSSVPPEELVEPRNPDKLPRTRSINNNAKEAPLKLKEMFHVKHQKDSFDAQDYIPKRERFENYVERELDNHLEKHYSLNKYPLTQGKQGTGKTTAHEFYAMKKQLPFFLFSCYEDFRLARLFGDKTIIDGSVKFQESLFTRAVQMPSVILFDEINAIANQNTFDFHALLQNRELFIKDANNGFGKTYKLHEECRIGFAQNPRSNKYIGGNIKPSNFLGRCTFLTFPEFTLGEISALISKRYPKVIASDRKLIVKTYFDLIKMIDKANIAIDISIRQLINVMDFISAGMDKKDAFDQAIVMFLDAASLPDLKNSFTACISLNFPELLNPKEKVSNHG